jgi:DNA invertase Pin-like site-specific DNA recombinase
MRVGYARVSTHEQTLDLQQDALKKAGCEKVFSDTVTGAQLERNGLKEALQFMRAGDILVVWKLDRLGRSLRHLIDTVRQLEDEGKEFQSITERIDTTTPGGKLIFHIFGALAEFERDLIRERTLAGLASARTRGKVGGRPRRLSMKQIDILRSLYQNKRNSIPDILKSLHISKTTLYRYVRRK